MINIWLYKELYRLDLQSVLTVPSDLYPPAGLRRGLHGVVLQHDGHQEREAVQPSSRRDVRVRQKRRQRLEVHHRTGWPSIQKFGGTLILKSLLFFICRVHFTSHTFLSWKVEFNEDFREKIPSLSNP